MEAKQEAWLRTKRLEIRRLSMEHELDCFALDSDPQVMEFINGGVAPESEGYSGRFRSRVEACQATHPLGTFALHEREGAMVGLVMLKTDPRFVEDVEVGWRLRPDRWGRGFATEGAQALIDFAFETLGHSRVIATTLTRNQASQKVMGRLGFSRVITFTYDAELLPMWNLQEREGQLFVLTREAWNFRRESIYSTGILCQLHHVQFSMEPGGEALARDFYRDVLGLSEKSKPGPLLESGGLWFEAGAVRIHLGLEPGRIAPRKAHAAFLVRDLDSILGRAKRAGLNPELDRRIPGVRRAYLRDPFGNRLELIAAVSGTDHGTWIRVPD